MTQSNRCRVYVGNLSWKVRWQQLKDHMKQVGEVIRADIIQDYDGKSRGCGIVEFSSAEYATKAINELNDTIIMQRPIFVREDREAYGAGIRKNRRYSHSSRDHYENDFNGAKYRQNSHQQEQDVHYYGDKRTNGKNEGDIGHLGHGGTEEKQRGEGGEFYGIERDVEDEYNDLEGEYRKGDQYLDDYAHREEQPKQEQTQEQIGHQQQHHKDSISTIGQKQQRSKVSETSSNLTVIVTNLRWKTSWQNLKDLFKTCGPVARVDIMSHQDGRSKGVAKITFGNEYAAKKAVITFHQYLLGGRRIGVRFAN